MSCLMPVRRGLRKTALAPGRDETRAVNALVRKCQQIHKNKSTVKDPMTCNKLDIYMDLPFRLLQEELTPCYTKMSGATVIRPVLLRQGEPGTLPINVWALYRTKTCVT